MKEAKANGVFKNGLPIMSINGKKYPQSVALLRYVGKKSNLYPVDHDKALTCDVIMDIVTDILSKAPQDSDPDKKKTLREEFAAGKMKTLSEDIVNVLKQSSEESGYSTGPSLCIADFWLYNCVAMVKSGHYDYIPTNYFDQFSEIISLCNKVAKIDAVKEHITYQSK